MRRASWQQVNPPIVAMRSEHNAPMLLMRCERKLEFTLHAAAGCREWSLGVFASRRGCVAPDELGVRTFQ